MIERFQWELDVIHRQAAELLRRMWRAIDDKHPTARELDALRAVADAGTLLQAAASACRPAEADGGEVSV